MKQLTNLETAELYFNEAISKNYPVDLIKILYDDLVKERRKVAKTKKQR